MESHDKTISPDDVFKPDERFKSGKRKISHKSFDDEHIKKDLLIIYGLLELRKVYP